jgi:hypothetical protein
MKRTMAEKTISSQQHTLGQETTLETVAAGRYRHYKGNEYTVVGVARHSETEEELVVYRQEYGDFGLWVRPKQMFVETVTLNGEAVPRFQWIGDATPT